MIRLLIVEDHPAMGEGLAALLAADPELEVVGLARDAATAEQLLADPLPDVVLCDVMLGGRDAGFDLLARQRERAAFLMYSAFDLQGYHAKAVSLGAAGFLSKTADPADILAAIHAVDEGRPAFSSRVLASAREAPRLPTRRELQLLRLLARGASNDEMAGALGIRVKTIEGMLRRLFDRYASANRTHLARYALEQGWVSLGDGPLSRQATDPGA